MMKTFSGGVSITPKLMRVKMAEGENEGGHWRGDLNITIQHLRAELVGIDGMEHLELSEHPQLKEKWHNKEFSANFFANLRSLMLDICASLSTAIPSNLLPFLDNLLELEVKNCDSVERVFDLTPTYAQDGQIGTLPRLNKLQLVDLPRLKHVWNEEPKGFFDFTNLEVFKLYNCANLRYIFTPCTCLGLERLRELEVKDCPLIEEIISKEATTYNVVFPLLTSISLEHLPNLTSFYAGSGTVRCPSLQKIAVVECSSEVISTFLNEQPPNATNHASQAKLVFPYLEELELSSIKGEEMWNSQHINQSSSFKHLSILVVEDCENMRYLFTYSMIEYLDQIERLDICNCKSMEEVVLRQDVGDGKNWCKMLFPKLKVLKLKGLPKVTTFSTCSLFECPFLKELQIDNCPQLKSLISDPTSADLTPRGQVDKCDSPLFDDKVAFPDVEELTIRNMYWLKTIWQDELHEDSFCKLRILRVEQAEALRKVFPSSMLVRRFLNLEELFIEDCESLEEVFDIQGLMINVEEAEVATAAWTQFIILDIRSLPNLKHVWNKDPRELLFFHNLNDVKIWDCPNLRSLFPASVARGLLELETLAIGKCGIEEIVEKEEGEETTAPGFVFPKLNNLTLWTLPELKRFYPGMHTSEWPALKDLNIYHCDQMHILECQRFQEGEELDRIQDERSLFSFQEVIPNLKSLALTCKEATMIWEGQFPEKLLHNLETLRLRCFHVKPAVLPSGLLQRFPNIGKLVLQCNRGRELFPYGLIGEDARPIPRIHELGLQKFPDAAYMRRKESQIDALLQNVDTLKVWTCNGLMNLAPFSASFQSITFLDIFQCRALVHLFTLCTAEALVQLSVMHIRNCDLVTEIIASTGHDTDHEIVFYKLASLELHHLPSLTSFCSREHSFKFPSLTEVIVSQCPKMEIFSKGVLRTPKLQSVKPTLQEDKECWNGNLNTTIQHLYQKMVGID
uniref:Putative disease resistance protein At4g27220 n=1 Tax=Rhizophora mucronata TaxID=61149 RepID=A0A2P2MRK2_RHIMU